MRLLITTQAVDINDPVLGFFHRWIEELAKRFEHVHVICLKEGMHQLPANVSVHSLGKDIGRSRAGYVLRFFHLIYSLRHEYDAVFVHMNSEYVCLGGLFWRQWGKRVVLWRNHPLAGFSTWLAAHLAHAVCYTSSTSYVARFKNAVKMPVGVDAALFSPGDTPVPENSLLFLGRLDAVKHPDIFLEALDRLSQQGITVRADIVGDPTQGREAYADELRERFAHLSNVSFKKAISNTQAPEAYRSHAIYVNLTTPGSFDKTLIEAAAAGCIIVCGNDALRDILPAELLVDPASADSVAHGIQAALSLSGSERARLSGALRNLVLQEHSLSLLAEQLTAVLHA